MKRLLCNILLSPSLGRHMSTCGICLCCVFLMLSIPQASSSADAVITQAEWAQLMQDAHFKAADQQLAAAYKEAMALLSEADKQTLRNEQRAWIAKRDKEAFAKFSKGTPEYIRLLIDKTYERTAILQTYPNMFSLLERPVYLKSWQALFSNEKDVPSWLTEFARTGQGVTSTAAEITIGGQRYLMDHVSKAHEANTNQFYVLFAENGTQAWGFLREYDYKKFDYEPLTFSGQPKERFFGHPDKEKQKLLSRFAECDHYGGDTASCLAKLSHADEQSQQPAPSARQGAVMPDTGAQAPRATPEASAASTADSTGPYLYELLKRPAYLKSWQALFSGEQDVPPWLAQYTKTGWVESPGKAITLNGQHYLIGTACKAHDCGDNQFYVLFAEDGLRAWGFLSELPYQNGHFPDQPNERFFGQPDMVKQKLLRHFAQCASDTASCLAELGAAEE